MTSGQDYISGEARQVQLQADRLVSAIRRQLREASLSPAEAVGWLLALAAQVDLPRDDITEEGPFQLPELPSGALADAQIVFLGRNPGLQGKEQMPVLGCPTQRYEDWYRSRFMPGIREINAKWYCQHLEPLLPEAYSLDMTAFLDLVPWKWPYGWSLPPTIMRGYAQKRVKSALDAARRMRALVALGKPASDLLVACGHIRGDLDMAEPKAIPSMKRESVMIVPVYHPSSYGNRGGNRQYKDKVKACLSACLRDGPVVSGRKQAQ